MKNALAQKLYFVFYISNAAKIKQMTPKHVIYINYKITLKIKYAEMITAGNIFTSVYLEINKKHLKAIKIVCVCVCVRVRACVGLKLDIIMRWH